MPKKAKEDPRSRGEVGPAGVEEPSDELFHHGPSSRYTKFISINGSLRAIKPLPPETSEEEVMEDEAAEFRAQFSRLAETMTHVCRREKNCWRKLHGLPQCKHTCVRRTLDDYYLK